MKKVSSGADRGESCRQRWVETGTTSRNSVGESHAGGWLETSEVGERGVSLAGDVRGLFFVLFCFFLFELVFGLCCVCCVLCALPRSISSQSRSLFFRSRTAGSTPLSTRLDWVLLLYSLSTSPDLENCNLRISDVMRATCPKWCASFVDRTKIVLEVLPIWLHRLQSLSRSIHLLLIAEPYVTSPFKLRSCTILSPIFIPITCP